jgi:hypothetical protein
MSDELWGVLGIRLVRWLSTYMYPTISASGLPFAEHISFNKSTTAASEIIPFIGGFINLVFGVDSNCEITG